MQCHTKEYEAWEASHHRHAMEPANKSSVLGRFSAQKLDHALVPAIPFAKGGTYYMRLPNKDGRMEDKPILYTFSFFPLQQYLAETENGRLQVLPWSWDARPEGEGGQRWLQLYPHAKETSSAFWRGPEQNWNFMCSDCHSTNVKKNFNSENRSYSTSFSEVSVGCEACHSGMARHVEDKQLGSFHNVTQVSGPKNRLDLSARVKQWHFEADNPTRQPQQKSETDQHKVCFSCHSRRLQLADGQAVQSTEYFDRYLPSLLDEPLFFADGQPRSETFIMGSFLQSKMFEKGVSCSDCHDPHSGQLVAPEPQVCTQCHLATKFATRSHTQHPTSEKSPLCSDCHMPSTLFMAVDARKEHSFRIPMPGVSAAIGAPDTCTSCHVGKTQQWAQAKLDHWNQNNSKNGEASLLFFLARRSDPAALDGLLTMAQSPGENTMKRAAAIAYLANYKDPRIPEVLTKLVRNKNHFLRLAVIKGARNLPQQTRWHVVEPLLSGRSLAIRTEAASVLVEDWTALSWPQKEQLAPALAERIATLSFNSDRAFSHLVKSEASLAQGYPNTAKQQIERALEVEPNSEEAHVARAEFLRSKGKSQEMWEALVNSLKLRPDSATLNYLIALEQYRRGDLDGALSSFKASTQLAPEEPRYWLALGLIQSHLGQKQSVSSLHRAWSNDRSAPYKNLLCQTQKKFRNKLSSPCSLDEPF
ncbi:multiheme c-type cytochrome [Pseudovibrio axinellae]|uniref:multiheme c-type cytochrome n=1 Tax=Pseudovibrio axinellae TaxID=989403 RepID=UPI003B849D1C